MADSNIKFRLTASDETQQAFNSAKRSLESIQHSAETVKRGLEAVGVSLGIKEVIEYGKSIIDLGDELNDMSTRTGVAVKTLASYKLAAEQSGTSLDAVAKGISKMTLSIGQAEQNNKEIAKSLVNLGITARDPQKAFEQLADAVAKSNNPNRLSADLLKVLGKNYSELLPLLKEGSGYLRESAVASESFAEQMAKLAPNADHFNDQLAQLKTNAAGATASFLSDNGLIDSLNKTAKAMTDLQNQGHGVLALLRGIAGIGKLPLDVLFPDKPETKDSKLKDLRQQLSDLQRQLQMTQGGGMLQRWLYGTTDELKQKILVTQNQIAAFEKFGDKIFSKPTEPTKSKPDAGRIDTSAVKATKASDPLAGLLGQTDIGRLKEFEKTVALLNARFDSGRKDTELYTQAMTKLVQSTFASNFKQAADDADFFRAVEQDGIKTTLEWKQNLDDLANVDMGRLNDLLANTDFARLEQSQSDMILLTKAFSEGIKDADGNLRKLSESEYLDAVKNRLNVAKDKVEELDTFAKTAAKNIQNSFADFLFNPFDKGIKGMVQGFGEMIQRMIANAVAADLAKKLFGGLADNGATSGSGWAGAALNLIGGFFKSANGNVFMNSPGLSAYSGSVVSSPTVFPFATGMGLMGEAGPEAILPLKRGSDGKLGVASGSGGHTINVYVNGTNAPDVRRAAGQGAREALGMISGAQRYA